MDNQTLILALKNGSEEAFTSLYHKYCDKVYKFCRLYYTNDSTTEEVVQEVFIKLWDIRSYVNENEKYSNDSRYSAARIIPLFSVSLLKKYKKELTYAQNYTITNLKPFPKNIPDWLYD